MPTADAMDELLTIDPPVPCAKHLLRSELGAVEVAAQVDADDRVPVLLAHVFGRLDDVDARVVHEDVDLPEGRDCRLDELATTLAVTRVDVRGKRRTTG